jgi:NADPH:quinone reductase-like Zn-dependent oxidoreductase
VPLGTPWRRTSPPRCVPLVSESGVMGRVCAGIRLLADQVFGLLRFPTSLQGSAYAEYVTAPASDLAHKPVGVDHLDAAGAAMAALTAWQFLIELGHDHPSPFQSEQHRPVAIGSSTTVLVNEAAGGVGHFAVQFAK